MKDYHKVIGSRGYVIAPVFQWKEVFKFKEYNWINFCPIQINFEYGGYKGKYFELTLIFMGIGFWFETYNKASRDKFAEELRERAGPEFKSLFEDNDG